MDKAILTCAVTGVLTDPNRFAVPVTPEQMAASTKQAYNAGASIVHVHFRRQEVNTYCNNLPKFSIQFEVICIDRMDKRVGHRRSGRCAASCAACSGV